MTVINNYSDLLVKKYPEDSDAFRYGSIINQIGGKAIKLTQQLLAIARQKPLEPEILSLNEAIANVQNLLQHMVGMHIEIKTNLMAEMDLVKTDPGQLDQVLINLAVNARDAMPTGGLLTIETSNLVINETLPRILVNLSPGRYVKLRVQDTGEGMNDFVKERIFEPFFTTKLPSEDSGSGLGLR